MSNIEFKEWISNASIKDLAEQIVLGPQEDILRKLEDFNNIYNTKLGVTNAFRWKPGTYQHYKDKLNELMMFNKRANSLARIHYRMSDMNYRIGRMKSSIQNIENALYTMRGDNIIFQDNSGIAEESLEVIKTIIDNADSKYGIKFYVKEEEQYGLNRTLFETVFPVGRGSIDVFTPQGLENQGKKISQVPYLYDTYIKASIPFRKFLNTFISLQNNSDARVSTNVHFTGKLKDNKYALKHPFIRGAYGPEWENYDENYDMKEWTYVCLGNMQNDFVHFMHRLDIDNVVWYLSKWHNNYVVNVTNPLNNVRKMYHGSPKYLNTEFYDVIGARDASSCTYPGVFDNTIQDIPYCTAVECTKRESCDFYKRTFYEAPNGIDSQLLYLLSEIYGDNYSQVVQKLTNRNIDYEKLYFNLIDPIPQIKELIDYVFDTNNSQEPSVVMLYEVLGSNSITRIAKGSTESVLEEEKDRLNQIYYSLWDDIENTLNELGRDMEIKFRMPFPEKMNERSIETVQDIPFPEEDIQGGPVPTEWAEYFANNNRRPV